MEILLDTSVIIAILLNEAEKPNIIERTKGQKVFCCTSVHAEIGNAFSALFKKNRLTLENALEAIKQFNSLNLHYENFNIHNALAISKAHKIYAYDAYLIDLAQRKSCALYTLDNQLYKLSNQLGITAFGNSQ